MAICLLVKHGEIPVQLKSFGQIEFLHVNNKCGKNCENVVI